MTRVVVMGDVMVDVVARLDAPVARGSDAPARISISGGGSAANVAAWLAAAGVRPALVGRVGDDPPGRDARAALEQAGVAARIESDSGRSTGTCVVIIEPGGERTMLPDAGANDALQPLPDDLIADGGHLHVPGYALLRDGSRLAASSAIERARGGGMTVSVDPSSAALLTPTFLELASGADLLLPNAEEARALTASAIPTVRRGGWPKAFRRWWSSSARGARCGPTAASRPGRPPSGYPRSPTRPAPGTPSRPA